MRQWDGDPVRRVGGLGEVVRRLGGIGKGINGYLNIMTDVYQLNLMISHETIK